MKLLIFIPLIALLCACKREKSTNLRASLINNSGQAIKFIPYRNGSPSTNQILIFSNNDTIEIANQLHLGIVNTYGFSSDYISGMDSIIIVFNDSFYVSHYNYNVANTSDKYHKLDHPRNIFAGANYKWLYIDNSKYSRTNYHYYTFTEADYEYAKQ